MALTFTQKIWREFKLRKLLKNVRGLPGISLVLMPQMNRHRFCAFLAFVFVVTPCVGYLRKMYIFNKFNKHLQSKTEAAELEIKQSIAKFQMKIPSDVDFMVIVNLDEVMAKGENQLSQVDADNSRKIFNLFEEASNAAESQEIKWAFIGSKKLYDTIENSRKKSSSNIQVEFHENEKNKKDAKVYLIGKNAEGEEKIMMEWGSGVGFPEIKKYIATLKYKQFLREVNF